MATENDFELMLTISLVKKHNTIKRRVWQFGFYV